MSHFMPFDDAFARSCALDLLVALRQLPYERKEKLFADAVIFYRWYITHHDEMEHLSYYLETFDLIHPELVGKLTDALQEAAFVTWFIEQGYHQLPVMKRPGRYGA